jgi:ELWxxDGT repeat protein
MFAGYDASGETGLWVTDGTAAGTSELIAVGAASGLNPSGITVLGTKALFEGFDASNRVELWVSDGTSAGTTELIPAGASSLGLFGGPPGLLGPDFTALGGKLLIQGLDTSLQWGLWVTDGTSAGTSELTTAGGGSSPDLTVLGNKALFEGGDNLWVTDGTSAGTSELNVAGAFSDGLFRDSVTPDFAILGNKAIFAGKDANGDGNLWTTNGTAAGTRELMATGASSFGLFDSSVLHPSFTILGTKALFIGANATNQSGLWVTDGTSGGTSELAGGNLFQFVINPHFTVLGSKMLFMGTDANFHDHLWVTNGTAAGTSELMVAGAGSLGLLTGDDTYDTNFITLGTKVLFEGEDASGHEGLWVTDGTAAGTNELTVAGAWSGGLFNSNDPDFTIFGGKVLFLGSDASGHPNLWVTDGTSAGTSEVTVARAYSGGLTPSDITVLPPPPPAPTALALAAGSDSGVKGDNITNVTKPVITGRARPATR